MDGRTEEQLVASCRSGDVSAYAGLVRAYGRRVFAICLGMLGNSHDAEDIAQQVLLRGFNNIGELRDGERFGAWIGQIAKNLCINFMRSRKRSLRALSGEAPARAGGPREYPELEAALAKLPEEYRVVLMLYYFDGRSTKNIAEALVISQSAVHTRLSRARRELRNLLDAEGYK